MQQGIKSTGKRLQPLIIGIFVLTMALGLYSCANIIGTGLLLHQRLDPSGESLFLDDGPPIYVQEDLVCDTEKGPGSLDWMQRYTDGLRDRKDEPPHYDTGTPSEGSGSCTDDCIP